MKNLYNRIPGFKENNYMFFLFLLLLLISIYYPIWSFDFLYNSDDSWMLVNNSQVWNGKINEEVFKEIFTQFHYGQYSPLNTLYYKALYTTFGLNPRVFHISNLIIHYINSLLIFSILKQLLFLKNWDSLRLQTMGKIATVFFAIHPANVEVVAWISCSKILLCTSFMLLSSKYCLFYLSTGSRYFFILSLIFAVVSFGFKEQSIILPLIFVSFWYFLGKERSLIFLFIMVPIGILSIVGFFWSVSGLSQTSFSWILNSEHNKILDKFTLIAFSVVNYVFNLLIPINLQIKYSETSFSLQILKSFSVLTSIFFLLSFLFLNWAYRHLDKFGGFGLLFFIFNILCFIHIVPLPRFTLLADRYTYLSSFGFIIFILSFLMKYVQGNRFYFVNGVYFFFLWLTAAVRCWNWESYFL